MIHDSLILKIFSVHQFINHSSNLITMEYPRFYSELGKLLYAVADIDKVISPKEKNELRKLVREELVKIEKSMDRFKTDSAFYTEFEFDILEESNADPEIAFHSFLDYIEDHKTAVDEKLINVIRMAAEKIANSSHKINEKERKLLHKLDDALNNLLKEKS